MTTKNYDASAIEVLEGLEPVRKRPGMYTDVANPGHLLREVVDNSVDEAIAGHASRIDVRIHEDGSYEVTDDGRGIPVDTAPGEEMSAAELVLSKLHAGGKFTSGAYRFSGGLHGVGVSVVNALSKRLEATMRRDGRRHELVYEGGEPRGGLKSAGRMAKGETGTSIRFWPDPAYFDEEQIPREGLKEVLEAKAMLCPGLAIRLSEGEDTEEWAFNEGIHGLMRTRVDREKTIPEEPIRIWSEREDMEVEAVLCWGPSGPRSSYANLVPTREGGTHLQGFRSGVTEAVKEYAGLRGGLPRGVDLIADDVWHYARYVLAVKMEDPVFAGQMKERLTSRTMGAYVHGQSKAQIMRWFNANARDADRIVQQIVTRAKKRQEELPPEVKRKGRAGPKLPAKLADCSVKDAARTEIFLVEGDSAGGSTRQGRSRETQAVMPLRGKILNTWEVTTRKALDSQEVKDICLALGVSLGRYKEEDLRYHKVCILADADPDGAHIRTLLIAMFRKHIPEMIEDGHLYVAMPPLYRIEKGREVRYALDEEERRVVEKELKGAKGSLNVQRFKGLGEMNPKQLRETTLAPETRRLVRVENGADDEQCLNHLLGKRFAKERRDWLEREGRKAQVQW